MRFRNSRLRIKITALLASLIALWAFAAWVTLREGLTLLSVNALSTSLAQPAVSLVTELQEERRLTLVYLGSPGPQQRQALDVQRKKVDKLQTEFREGASSGSVSRAADDTLEQRIQEFFGRLDGLSAGRRAVDAGSVDRGTAVRTFNDAADAAYRLYGSAGAVDDEEIAKDSRTLNSLTRAKEILSREDALLAGALSAGRLTAAEQSQFVQLVGTQRFLHEEAAAELPAQDRADYLRLVGGPAYQRLSVFEDRILQARPGPLSRSQSDDWRSATRPVQAELEKLVLTGGDRLVERATPMALGVILRLALAGGLGMLAVIASIVVSITTARALVRQLERLRGAAWELAEQRLPGVVERLGHGEKVDVAAEAPPLEFGTDEIGQVGRAFNAVQQTAIATAVEQAELRRGIRDVLLSLARRTQTLVHRQLSMLDTMERRRDIDSKQLEELFRLDHLATRMRRNAENLIVLSGAIPARGWRRSVPMVDVVRAAVGEVEDYTRVQVLPFGPVELTGRAVGDLTHLLAELIENAVSFSPPDTVVQIGGHLVASGFAIDIEDRGLGMTDEKLAELNDRIADPPEFNLQSSVQLGLFVVGKLAERYGVQVMLKRSAYGGTTAVLVVPRELVVEDPGSLDPSEAERDGPRAVPEGTTTENGLEVRQPTMVSAAPARDDAAKLTPVPALAPVPDSGRTSRTTSGMAAGQGSTGEFADRPVPAPTGAVQGLPQQGGSPTTTTGRLPSPETPKATTATPEELPPVADIDSTPSGLPVRVPQANLAPALRATTEVSTARQEAEAEEDQGRSPAEIQRIMGSFQRGTRRGRSDAARAAGSAESGRSDAARAAGTAEGGRSDTGSAEGGRSDAARAASRNEGEEDQ